MKKSSKRKSKRKSGLLYVFLIVIVLIIVSIFLFNNREIYKISSRTENVKKTKVINNSKFETVGWIRVQGTNIDYPVIYCEDSHEDFPVKLNSYVWLENPVPNFNNNIRITGHNIFNLSSNPKIHSKYFKRFEELMAFVYYDFAQENEYIQLTIDGKNYLYKIFSVSFIDISSATFLPKSSNMNSKDFIEFQKIIDRNNIYDYDVDINKNDKFITLSTCTRSFINDIETNYYVHGRLLRTNEKAKKYKVKKSNNYKIIDNMLKENEDEEDQI